MGSVSLRAVITEVRRPMHRAKSCESPSDIWAVAASARKLYQRSMYKCTRPIMQYSTVSSIEIWHLATPRCEHFKGRRIRTSKKPSLMLAPATKGNPALQRSDAGSAPFCSEPCYTYLCLAICLSLSFHLHPLHRPLTRRHIFSVTKTSAAFCSRPCLLARYLQWVDI